MKSIIESKWDEILSLLATEYDISPIMIQTWLKTLKIFDVKDNTVYFYVDEALGENALKFIKKKEFDIFLLSSIRQTLSDSNIDIVIDVKKNLENNTPQVVEEPTVSDSYKEAITRSNLNPKYTFESFIVGDSNRHAHATCLAVADMPAQDTFNPLYLYGKSGLGKTHLMQAIAHYILQNDENMNVLYVPAETFTNEIIDAIRHQTTNEFRDKYRNVDVLLLDDVQFLIGKESTQNEFFHTFNSLYNDKKQIILSSDRPPKDITTLDERIISRFECGVPIDIHEPDYETRMAILKNKADMDNLVDIPDEVFVYIAENITSNIRELEGALNKINVYAKISKTPLTIETAKEALKDIISKDSVFCITSDLILKTVSEHYNISVDDICSKKRSQDIALARQIVMYLCREYTVNSLKTIGNVVGGKDHTTVMSGVDRVKQKLTDDPSFKANIDSIVSKLNPNA